MKRIITVIVILSIILANVSTEVMAAGISSETMYKEGMEFFEQKDYDRAFARFQISGEVRGYAPAQNMLGVCYRDGLGAERDLVKAEEYFRLSADQGYIPAQENVAALSEDAQEQSADSTPTTDSVPAQVSAEEKEVVIPWAENVKIGDVVKFGSYEQDNDLTNGSEPIEWLILDVQEGKALLLSRNALDFQLYNITSSAVTWEACTLRTWLNCTFLNEAFGAEEQRAILTVKVTSDKNPVYSTNPGNTTQDKVFLFSIAEANRYFSTDDERFCIGTAYCFAQRAWMNSSDGSCAWWLRSPGAGLHNAAYVMTDGAVDSYGHGVPDGATAVRPALWISLDELPKREELLEYTAEREQKAHAVLAWPDELKTGDTIEFGMYEQDGDLINGKEPIEWIALEVTNDEALLLSTKALECRPYTNESSDQVTWETCSLRQWLNNNFLMEAFGEQEQERIPFSEVSADKNPSFSTEPGKTTNDKIFILSLFETRQYLSSDSERQCCPTVYCGTRSPVTYQNGNCWWWIRTPGSISSFAVAVDMNGTIKIDGMRANNPDHVMVRPALRVNLKSGNA